MNKKLKREKDVKVVAREKKTQFQTTIWQLTT